MTIPPHLFKILDLARWAPSGDNCQPWKFQIISDSHVVIHGSDTRDWCLYDFDGHASHIAHGALIETIRIAASGEQLSISWKRRSDSPEGAAIFDIFFQPSPDPSNDPLLPFIEARVVQRRIMKTKRLSNEQKSAISRAGGTDFDVRFFESNSEKLKIAELLWRSAYVRLTCPEAYAVHREVIEWGARFSNDKIPEEAVGADPLMASMMQWVMGSWKRVNFFNNFMFGTILPRIELDALPAFFCGAHLVLQPRGKLTGTDDYVKTGMAIQRIWLTAAEQGLFLQPEMTPLIFRWYARRERSFSAEPHAMKIAKEISGKLERIAHLKEQDDIGFFCRLGESNPPSSRSLRKSLDELIIQP
ncbi:MAG: nitroreductase family protein [Zoogloea sp.]|nr:nitroreductase family protein [Zoogloea sp.]MCA0186752.1 molybdopterin biosynthesis protein MoeY [Pseudomonadota bacterium]